MPRHLGCKNQSEYKYEVQTLIDGVWVRKMYISQKDISAGTGLKRTMAYYLATDPEKVKKTTNFKIKRLEEPLPVFSKVVEEDDDDGYKIIKFKKNLYV